MPGPEVQRESGERMPDFETLAGNLAETLSETENPAILTVLKNTLKFLDNPEQVKNELGTGEFDQIKSYIEGLKNAPDKIEDLRALTADRATNPDLKRLVTELLRYLNGEKNIEAMSSVETAEPGAGIPISAPPSSPNAEAPDQENSEHPDQQLEEQLADMSETDEETQQGDQSDQSGAVQPEGAAQPETDTAKEAGYRQTVENMQNTEKEVSKMGMGELVKKFIELAKSLPGLLKGLSDKISIGAATPAYTEEQIKESTPDFSRVNEAEPITSDNKSVEYVARVLNLPAKPNAEEFLAALKQSPNCVFQTEKEVSKLKPGDVLFFHDGQNREKASVTALVSETGPPAKMKLVNEGENVREVEIEQSSLFNNWLGYVRMPQSPESPPPA